MRVDCALLCDAATVREGLLHILGGGITRLTRQEFPGTMGIVLALRIVIHPTEADLNHEGQVIVQTDDGQRVGDIQFAFAVTDAADSGRVPGEEFAMAAVIPLRDVAVRQAGGYSIELLLDKQHRVSVPFVVIGPEPTTAIEEPTSEQG